MSWLGLDVVNYRVNPEKQNNVSAVDKYELKCKY